MKEDPEMTEFMKRNNLYVEGVNKLPEVREVNPGHLVRAGRSTSFDVNFGMEAGAAAVILLTKGLGGNTVSRVRGTKITYKPTAEVIKQRHVDTNTVALYETMGVCFGRKPEGFTPDVQELQGEVEREY